LPANRYSSEEASTAVELGNNVAIISSMKRMLFQSNYGDRNIKVAVQLLRRGGGGGVNLPVVT